MLFTNDLCFKVVDRYGFLAHLVTAAFHRKLCSVNNEMDFMAESSYLLSPSLPPERWLFIRTGT